MGQFSYFVDMNAVKLNEDNTSWIQCMPNGSWEHPYWGTIQFSDERARRFADNFRNNVVGKDLDIDFEHKLHTGEAAGWIKDAQARPGGGLFLQVEWTPKGAASIKNKEFRYFSPEYHDEWEHPSSGQKFSDVLMGGGLTNRPFLKGIAPVNLSELFAETQSGGKMGDNPGAGSQQQPKQFTVEDLTKMLSDNPDLIKNLPAVKELTEQNGKLTEQVTQLAEQNKALLDDNVARGVEIQLSEFTKGTKVLSTATLDLLRPILLSVPKETGEKIIELMEAVRKGDAVVQLGELGGKQTTFTGNAIKQFTEKVGALQKEHSLSYSQAAMKLSTEEPDLYKAYLEETMQG